MKYTYRDAAKLYSSKCISALANGDFSFLEKVSQSYHAYDSSKTLSCYFDDVYQMLGRDYRSEYYFKNFLALRHLIGRHSLKTATMLSEFRVGRSKADCVILNGKSTCYEIKTEFDNLSRLPEQLSDYSKLFDEIYVVCSGKNVDEVLESIDEYIGVLVLTDKNYFKEIKTAKKNPNSLDKQLLMNSLRKEEYTELVKRLGFNIPNVPNSELFTVCSDYVLKIEDDVISACFTKLLKQTRANKQSLIEKLPKSLTNAVISYQFTKKQEEALINIFN